MARYGMVIDKRICLGCNQCAVMCKMENNLPDGVWWNKAVTDGAGKDVPSGKFGGELSMSWYTLSCQHCSNPACVEVCPTGASYVDEEFGMVLVDAEKCIGCESCIVGCPYEGVRTLVEQPEWFLDFAAGDVEAPQHVASTVGKCTMCRHRMARGETPACIDVCPQIARHWGDLDDPESEVSKFLAENEHVQLLADQGTEPNTYFLV